MNVVNTQIKNKLLIAIAFGMAYFLIFSATSIYSGFIHERISLAFSFENAIPYYPAWAFVYLSINLFLWCALVVFPRWQPLAALAITLTVETVIAGACFILIPVKLVYAPVELENAFSTVIQIARFFSMKNNYLPSLHTAFAFTCAYAYQNYCSMPIKTGFLIWACLIPLSTLFIHEHHIPDLLSGFILAWLSYMGIFKPLNAFFDGKTNA